MGKEQKTEQERFTNALRVHHDVYSLDPDIDVVGQFKEILDSSILGDPMTGVKSKMQSDEDYAHTWFVNLHNLVRDSQGMLNSQITENVVEFMRNTFEVDINPETQRINDIRNDFCVGDFFVEDYKNAPSGEGPLASTWEDKPHRLIYDLCQEIRKMQRERLDQGSENENNK